LVKTKSNRSIGEVNLNVAKLAAHETPAYISERLQKAMLQSLAKAKQAHSIPNKQPNSTTNPKNGTTNQLINNKSVSTNVTSQRVTTNQELATGVSTNTIYATTKSDLPNGNFLQNNISIAASGGLFGSKSNSSISTLNSNNNYLNTLHSKKYLGQAFDTNPPFLKVLKEKIDFVNNTEDKKYWKTIYHQLQNGVPLNAFYGHPEHETFTDFYNNFIASYPLEQQLGTLEWNDTKQKIASAIKSHLLGKSEADNYWQLILKRLQNPSEDLLQLFREHQELFLILQDVLNVNTLPQRISFKVKEKIYPKLFTENIYADIGKNAIYGELKGLELIKVDGKYHILQQLDEAIVSNVGEKVRKKDGSYPALLETQWYAKDRINNPTKVGSTFWKAAIFNTENEKAYLYKTIEQRNAYYKFVDAYLKHVGITSEWYDAAVRVTINSPILGEVGVGAAGIDALNLWFLNDETEKFLREGNEFLFSENMNNVKLLLQGKGKINMSFTDANGIKQIFEGLTKKELDFKLVEFEQSLVGEYIKKYLKENKKEGFIRDWNEFTQNTAEEELERIIKQVNGNFDSWMAEDLTQDIMRDHFTKDGRVTFDFSKYSDRVKLGQIMVEELYYKRSKDTFKKENFDKILADNKGIYLNKLQESDHERLIEILKKYNKDLIPARNPKKLKEFYAEIRKDYERLQVIFKGDKDAKRVFNNIGSILDDIEKAVGQEAKKIYQETEEYILNKIEEYQKEVDALMKYPFTNSVEESMEKSLLTIIFLKNQPQYEKEKFLN